MPTTLPKGIGTEAEVDQANRFAREQQWYQDQLRQMGQDPNNVRLSDDQRDQLLQTMRERGIGISDHFEIDESGNIRPKSGLGKKLLIGAAIGGAALTGLGIAGIGPLSGLFGAGGASAASATGAGATTAGVLPSTTIGTGMIGPIAGGTGLSTAGTISKVVGGVKSGLSTADKIANALRMGGQAVSGAEKEAANARTLEAQLALQANQENIAGTSASESALMNRAQLEMAQRKQAQRDMARASYMHSPFQSPFAPTPSGPRFSSQYMQAADAVSDQAGTELGQAPVYGARGLSPLKPYKPIDITDIPGATGTTPGLGSRIGNYVGPGLSILGAFLNRNQSQPMGGF